MPYFKIQDYKHTGYQKSNTKDKMYDAILKNKKTSKNVKIPFGDINYQNFKDDTGLNLYKHLIHGDKKRRKSYRARHKGFLKDGYYSPSHFSYNILW